MNLINKICEQAGLLGVDDGVPKIVDYYFTFKKVGNNFIGDFKSAPPDCICEGVSNKPKVSFRGLMNEVWERKKGGVLFIPCDLNKYVYWGFPVIEEGDVVKGNVYAINVSKWTEVSFPAVLLDESGIIHYVTPLGSRLVQEEKVNLIGKDIFDFIHKEDIPSFRSDINRCFQSKEPVISKYRLLVGGHYVSYANFFIPIITHTNTVIGFIITGTEIDLN